MALVFPANAGPGESARAKDCGRPGQASGPALSSRTVDNSDVPFSLPQKLPNRREIFQKNEKLFDTITAAHQIMNLVGIVVTRRWRSAWRQDAVPDTTVN